jgi:hypothetical protein
MPLIAKLFKTALMIGCFLPASLAPVAAEDDIGDHIQPLVLRYCKLVPGNWRRTAAVLSVMPPETMRRMRIPFEDVGTTQQCAETVKSMMCSAEYLNELEGLLKEVYKIPDLDNKLLACGALGGIAGGLIGLAVDDSVGAALNRAGKIGGSLMTACGIVYSVTSIGGCEKRKAELSKMAGRIHWPEQIESPARFELQTLRAIENSGLETEQTALMLAEIEARYKTLHDLPNTMGDR